MYKGKNIVGLIVAKENSNRFPGKNYYKIKGVPMFWYNVELLQHTKLVDDIYIVTNSEFIKSYSEKRGIKIIWRGPNCSSDDEPLFNIIKYGYKSLEKRYDYIIHIMANSINNDKESIDLSIKHIHNLNLKEVRSYDKKGIENGLMVLHSDVMLKNELSTYVGMVQNNAKEIHVKEDLNGTL